jgi:YVTN family beta-propeller protein
VATLQVSPDPVSLVPYDSVQMNVSALDGAGHLVTGVSVVFVSSDTSIITVSAVGMVRSKGPVGAATITVGGGGVAKLVPVTVTQTPVAVLIFPTDTSIPQGGSLQYRAMVMDAYGDSIPGQAFTYAWTDSSLITVSGSGVATSIGASGEVYVRARSGSLTSFFARLTIRDTNIVARLPLAGGPLGIAASGNIAYVSRDGANKLQRLNLVTALFTDSVSVGSLPCYLVFNAAGTKAYVANQFSQSVSVVDVATNTQSRTIPVTGDPLPVAISGDGNTLFVTTNANRLYKIALANDSVVDSIGLPATSHHLLMHPNDTLLYVATRDAGTVLEVNWRTMTIARTFTLGGRTQGMAISLDRSELYVANEASSQLHIVTLANGNTPTPITLAGGGEGLALSGDGTKLYVGLVFNGKVQIINRVGRTVLQTISTGGTPREIAADAARSHMLVANEAGWVDIIR